MSEASATFILSLPLPLDLETKPWRSTLGLIRSWGPDPIRTVAWWRDFKDLSCFKPPSLPHEDKARRWPSGTRQRAATKASPCWTLIWNCKLPELGRNKLLWLKSPSLSYVVMIAQNNEYDTERKKMLDYLQKIRSYNIPYEDIISSQV